MKNMRKFVSIILSAAMLATSMPEPGFSMENVPAVEGQMTETAEAEEAAEAEASASAAETTAPENTAPKTTAPETTAPETTAPETAAPETAAPETTAPETTAPETTAPETTAPETSTPETTAPETKAPETTAPETSTPETTAPETSVPEPTTPETPAQDAPSLIKRNVKAAIEENTSASGDQNGYDLQITVNESSQPQSAKTGADGDAVLHVAYGDKLSFRLVGAEDAASVSYFYGTAAQMTANDLKKITFDGKNIWTCSLTPGQTYYLTYDASVGTEQKTLSSLTYAITVDKAKLAAPTGLIWNGSEGASGTNLSWTAPEKAVNGYSQGVSSDVDGYTVYLYKDGSERAAYQYPASTAGYSNLDNNISADAGLGAGSYCYKVVTHAKKDSAYFTDSDLSDASSFYVVPRVEVMGDDGVDTVTPSSAFLLFPGNSSRNKQALTAEVKNGYSFSGWKAYAAVSDAAGAVTAGDAAEGFNFDPAAGTSATVTIDANYNGPVSVILKAETGDTTVPEISKFNEGEKAGTLTATAEDGETGIAAYAFTTTGESLGAASDQWTRTDSPLTGSKTFSYTLNGSGILYFHVLDASGNESVSDSLDVTQIRYHDIRMVTAEDSAASYRYSSGETVTQYKIGSNEYSMPNPSRSGYTFAGWFASGETTGNAVTSVDDHNTSAGYDFYPGWEEQAITFTAQPAGVTKIYNAEASSLSAEVSTVGTLSYQWYKNNQAIDGATGNTLDVKDVADSGTYKVKVTLLDEDGTTEIAYTYSNEASVSITAKPIVVKPADQKVTYGDAAPDSYTVQYFDSYDEATKNGSGSGFVGEDNASVLLNGEDGSSAHVSAACAYDPADDQNKNVREGGYPITVTGLEAGSHGNYDVTIKEGTLTVDPKTEGLTAAFAKDGEDSSEDPGTLTLTYTGQEQKPAVIVKDGETVLTKGEDYTLSYENNTNASRDAEDQSGKASVTVTFAGNYAGTKTLYFTIGKATYEAEVLLDGWTYGDTASEPKVSNDPGNADVTYYYAEKPASAGSEEGSNPVADSDWTEVQPKNAGTYLVYAILAETGNYTAVTTEQKEFTIAKRGVTLTADSAEFTYDGASHADSGYTMTRTGATEGDTSPVFPQGEGFRSVTVAGSITEVGTADNKVSYELTSATSADNYEITAVDGVLEVNPLQLTVPADIKWSASNPGTATWVAVSKEGLTPSYKLTLYAYDAEKAGSAGAYTQVGDVITIANNTYDLSSAIRTFATVAASKTAEEGGPKAYSYVFKVQALSGDNQNYADGPESDYTKIAPLYTAQISTELLDGSHVTSMTFKDPAGTSGRVSSVTLLKGETAEVDYAIEPGYKADHWYVNRGDVDVTSSFRFFTQDKVTVSTDSLTGSIVGGKVGLAVKDIAPAVYNFESANAADLKSVVIKADATDQVGLSGYMLVKKSGTDDITAPEATSEGWTDFSEDDKNAAKIKISVTKPGEYALFVKDTDGNVTRARYGEWVDDAPETFDTHSVYQISFEKGQDGIGSMDAILKTENTSVKLPHHTFENDGFAFQNWHGSTGVYEDEGYYAANSDDTLTAYWTDTHFDVKVNYFFMKVDGTYPGTPDQTNTFNALYGRKLDENEATLQIPHTGFSVDTSDNKGDKITVSDVVSSNVLNVYYARNKYDLTFTYTLPGATDATVDKKEVYYEASIADEFAKDKKPSVAGYDFVGWLLGDSGSVPEKMPANDVSATGSFRAKAVQVHVRYYEQNLNDDGTAADTYTLDSALSTWYNAVTDQEIAIAADQFAQIIGFEYQGTKATYGNENGAALTAEEAAVLTQAGTAQAGYDGTVSANKETGENSAHLNNDAEPDVSTQNTKNGGELYLNVYYKRAQYTVTLNVWQDTINVADHLKYTHQWKLLYGAHFDGDSYKDYKVDEQGNTLDEWPHDPSYTLAEYVDWSTGSQPETMPAGDVTITRQFVPTQEGTYQVEVYVEGDQENVYAKHVFNYYGNVGSTVTIGGAGIDSNTNATIEYSSFESMIDHFVDYQYREVTENEANTTIKGASADGEIIETLAGGTVLSGEVTDTTKEGVRPLVLRIFLERQKKTATIRYHVIDTAADIENGEKIDTIVATVKKSVKWGHKFDYEPLALFDTMSGGNWQEPDLITEKSAFATVDGTNTSADTFDFRNEKYVVSYGGYYYLYEKPTWQSKDFDEVDDVDLSKRADSYKWPMGYTCLDKKYSDENIVNIYYTKVDPEKFYYLDVVYNSKGLKNGKDENVPLTYTISDKTYKIRLASEASFYKDATYKEDTQYADYPGLAVYNLNKGKTNETKGTFVYSTEDSNVKDGFKKTVIGNYTYFLDDANGYIYIPVEDNNLYAGRLFSYRYGGDANHPQDLSYDQAEDFLANYKDQYKTDPTAAGASIYQHWWGSSVVTGNSTLVITFMDGRTVTLTYNVGEAKCSKHKYAMGGTVYVKKDEDHPADFGCNDGVFAERTGYHLEWYSDSDCKNKITDNFTIDKDTNVYGKYVRNTVVSHETAYYELKDHKIGENERTYLSDLTDEQIAALKDARTLTSSVSNPETVTMKDEFNETFTAEAKTTTWFYNGEVVMIDKEHPTLSFSDVVMNPDSSLYHRDGIPYDDANAKNNIKGYAQASPVTLRAFFKRSIESLTVDQNLDADINNPETADRRFGESIVLPAVTRTGYEFSGWTFASSEDGNTYEEYASWPEKGSPERNADGTYTFSMPYARYLKATAQWTAADYDQTVTHYYQNTDLSYDTAAVAAMQQAQQQGSGTAVKVVYGGSTYDGTLYANGGVSFSIDGQTFYAANPETQNTGAASSYHVGPEQLSAVVTTVSMLQDSDVTVSSIKRAQDNYTFAYAVRQYKEAVHTLQSGDSFKAQAGMQLDCYYNLHAVTISAEGLVSDGKGNGGLQVEPVTVVGSGGYSYGKTVNLTAATAAGYTFAGWYEKSAVDAKKQTDGSIDLTASDLTPVSTDRTFTFKAEQDVSYVAVVSPDEVATPDIQVNGTQSLTYGYRASTENAVKAVVKFADGTDSANYVKSYSWYMVDADGKRKDLPGNASAASYLIPEGFEEGTYKLQCDVTIARRDNGRSRVVTTGQHQIVVSPSDMTVRVENYSGTYDGEAHTIGVTVDKPAATRQVPDQEGSEDDSATEVSNYTIYYADTELTADNYAAKGNTDVNSIAKTNVNVVNEKRTSYTVYYFIKSNNHNYKDMAGSASISITPIQVTLSPGTAGYSKVYDGLAEVTGSTTDSNSDMYKLAHNKNVYSVNGLLEKDKANDNLVIDGNAVFNSRHVKEASSITLSVLKMVDASNAETGAVINYNYVFDSSYAITLTGYIKPKHLALNWPTTTFPYNGQEQGPQATYGENLIPEADKGHFTLVTTGKQTNAGEGYHASAAIELKSGAAAGDTQISDFSLDNAATNFEITRLPITVTPKDKTVEYDGKLHTMTGDEFTLTSGTLASGQTYTSGTDHSYKNVAQSPYTITAKNVHVFDVAHVDVTDNYTITFGTGTLTITAKTVTVTGITAADKVYDGTTAVTISKSAGSGNQGGKGSSLTFAGIVSGDTLDLDMSKVSAAFADANVGNDKQVDIHIGADALAGASAGNYTLNVGDSQKSTTANITAAVVTVKAEDKNVVYGEMIAGGFTVTYSGIIDGEQGEIIKDNFASGITYQIVSQSAGSDQKQRESYAPASDADIDKAPYTSAGTYTIYPDVSSLTSGNYTFEAATGTLIVAKRPVAVSAANGANIIKTYDGTTEAQSLVKTSDYQFTAVDRNAASGLKAGDSIHLTYTAAYDSKDATTDTSARKVEMTALSIDNPNYTLVTTKFEIPGTINKMELTITAKDETIIYGDAAPAYSILDPVGFVSVNGISESVSDSDLKGTLSFACDYDASDANKRNAGTYDIVPSGYTSDNYDIKYVKGTLTVNKAVLTIRTVEGSVRTETYTEGGKNEKVMTATYGTDPIPTFSNAVTGLKYADTVDVISGYSAMKYKSSPNLEETEISTTKDGTTTTQKVISSVTGLYTITPDVSTLSADNYTFATGSMDLWVKRYGLTVRGILINSRVYDGTTKVYDGQIDYSGLTLEGLLAIDTHYFNENGTANSEKVKVTGTYDDKDVAENKTVSLTIEPGEYLKQRCYVITTGTGETTQKTGSSSITRRPITITADNKTVKYGESAPKYTVTYEQATSDSGRGLVNTTIDSGVANETADGSNITLTCSYQPADGNGTEYSDAGTYTITPSKFRNSTTSANLDVDNYANTQSEAELNYVSGVLTVQPNQLKAPSPAWDTSVPGTVRWSGVPGIGNVQVASYKAELYKDGVKVSGEGSEKTVDSGNTSGDPQDGSAAASYSVNFADQIRAAGAGAYTVKVTAIASTENNADHKNVLDSEAGESVQTYAAAVTFVFSSDAATQNGKGTTAGSGSEQDKDNISIHDASSYTMIAGESNISIKAYAKNATGYTAEISSDHSDVLTIAKTTDNFANGTTTEYSSSVSLAGNSTVTDSITVTIKLLPRPASVASTVAVAEGSSNEAIYGYSSDQAPKFKATASHTDEVGPGENGYTYTYEWQVKDGYNDADSYTENTSDVFSFPTGKSAVTNNDNYYLVKCIITATRTDNGQTAVSVSEGWTTSLPYVTNVKIDRASFIATPTMEGWTYGEARKAPTFKTNLEGTAEEQQTGIAGKKFTYANKDAADKAGSDSANVWSETIPRDAGTYYVRISVPASTNYSAYTSSRPDSTEGASKDGKDGIFTISKAKLADPTGLTMDKTATGSYGTLKWDAVSGYKENGVNATDSDSNVTVKYEVKLYKKSETGTSESSEKYELIQTYNDVPSTSINVFNQMQGGGVYRYSVQAMDVEQDGKDNCDPSDIVYSADISVGGSISITGTGHDESGTYVHTYDSSAVTLTASYSGSSQATRYQWYKDGEKISGATANTLELIYVIDSQSHNYDCLITTENGEVNYTPAKTVKILPREITVHTGNAEKVYDGTALTKNEWWITDETGEGAESAHAGTAVDSSPTSVTDSKAGNDIISGVYVDGAITNVAYDETGSSKTVKAVDNTFSIEDLVITRGTGDAAVVVYSKNMTNPNYTINTDPGTLKITQRENSKLHLSVDSISKVWDNVPAYVNGRVDPAEDTTLPTGVSDTIKGATKLQFRWKYHNSENWDDWKDWNKLEEGSHKFTTVQYNNGEYTTLDVQMKASNPNYAEPAESDYASGSVEIKRRHVKVEVSGTKNADGTVTAGEKNTAGVMQIRKTYGTDDPVFALSVERSENLAGGRGAIGNDYNDMVSDFHVLRDQAGTKEGEDVGTYALTTAQTVNQDSDHHYNYEIEWGTAEFIIDQAPAASMGLAATTLEKTYDGQSHALDAATVDEDITQKGSKETTIEYCLDPNVEQPIWKTDLPVFTDATVNAQGVQSKVTVYVRARNDNFAEAATATATVKIKKRPITIFADSAEKLYDGQPLSKYSYTITNSDVTDAGLANGQHVKSVSYAVEKTNEDRNAAPDTGKAERRTNVGVSDNVVSNAKIIIPAAEASEGSAGTEEKDVTANYNITYERGTLKVVPLPVQLTWENTTDAEVNADPSRKTNMSLTYNDAEQSVVATVANAVKGDTVNVTAYQMSGKTDADVPYTNTATEVGSYQAKATTLDNQNYTLGPVTLFEGTERAETFSAKSIEQAWSIHYLETDALAYLSGNKIREDSDWFTDDVTIHAPEGYTISNTLDGDYGESLTITKESDNNTFTYYLKNTNTGYRTGTGKTTAKVSKTGDKITSVVKIDKTAPSGTISIRQNSFSELVDKITFGYFFRNSESVSIDAQDKTTVPEGSQETVENGSGIEKTEYYVYDLTKTDSRVGLTRSNLEALDQTEWTEGVSLSLSANKKVLVYARITDKAGHVTYIGTDGLVVYTDSAQNTASVAHTRTDADDKTAKVTLNGNTISKITVTAGTGESATVTDITADADKVTFDADGNITLKSGYLNTLPEGNYTVAISSNPLGETYRTNTVEGKDKNDAPTEVTFGLKVSKHADNVAINKEGKKYDGTPLTVTADDVTRKSTADAKDIQILYKKKGEEDSKYQSEAPTNAGTYIVKVIVPGDDNYRETTVTKELTISKADQTITAKDVTAVYDGQQHQIAATVAGVTGGSEPGTLTYSDNNSLTNFGETAVTVSAAETGNYKSASVTAVLKVLKRNVTLTSGSGEKEYDGTPLTKQSVTVSGNGFVDGEGASYDVTGSQTLVGFGNNTFNYTLNNGTSADNYNITKVEGKLTVHNRKVKYEITVKANSETVTYDGQNHTVTGFQTTAFTVNGQQYTVSGLSTSDPVKKNAGTYTNSITGTAVVKDAAGNDVTAQFDVKTVDGSLTIKKKAVTLTSATDSKEYDGTALTNDTVTAEGFVGSEGASYQVAGSQILVGISNNTFTYKLNDGTLEDNYDIKVQYGTLTVTNRNAKYHITVEANSATATYDGQEHSAAGFKTLQFTVDGGTGKTSGNDDAGGNTENGQRYVVSGLTTENPEQKNAGTYTNNIIGTAIVTDANGNDVTAQFAVNTVNGSLTITTKDVTITSATDEKEYDGTPLTNSRVAAVGFVEGEGASYHVTGSQTLVGSSSNTFTYTLNDGTLADNYNITTEEGTLTVTSRRTKYEITVEANSGIVTYDGQKHAAAGFRTTEFTVNGQKYNVSGLTTENPEKTNAGIYTNNVTGTAVVTDAEGHDVTDQFEVKTRNGSLTINKKTVTLTSATVTKEYDGTALTNDAVTAVGFVDGEGAAYEVTGSQTLVGSSKNEFSYTLNEGTLADNYNITKVEGTLTVTDRSEKYEITMEANSGTATYDGQEHTAAGFRTAEFMVNGQQYTVDGLKTENPEKANAGTYTNNISGTAVVEDVEGNDVTAQFNVKTVDGSLIINKKKVALTSAADSKVYDGTPLINDTVEADGFVGSEGASYQMTGSQTVVGSSSNSFTYKMNEGTLEGNYDIKVQYGTLTVTKKDVTLTSATDTKEYDGTALTNSDVTAVGFVKGEGASYDVTGSQTLVGSSKNTFGYTLNDGTLADNYNITIEEGTLTVTSRKTKYEITVEANSETLIYDGQKHTAAGVKTLEFTVGGETGETGPKFTVSGLTTEDPVQKDAGTYTNHIMGTAIVRDANGNDVTDQFTVNKVDGSLTIEKSKLEVPKNACGDVTKPGTFAWDPVDGIGDVTVSGYEVRLIRGTETDNGSVFDDGGVVKVITVKDATSVNLADAMKEAGAGQYRADVRAIASEDHNEGKNNVEDSDRSRMVPIEAAGEVKKDCEVEPGAPETTFNNSVPNLIDMGILTDSEVRKVGLGETANIILKVAVRSDAQVAEQEQQKIEAAAGLSFNKKRDPNVTVHLHYFDVTLWVRITNTKTENGTQQVSTTERQLSDARSDISVTITVPEEIRKEGRVFELFHMNHSGEAESFGRFTGDTYTFTTRQFSTYALAYHDHVWDSGKVTKQPTTSETGVKTYICEECGETKTVEIPKLPEETNKTETEETKQTEDSGNKKSKTDHRGGNAGETRDDSGSGTSSSDTSANLAAKTGDESRPEMYLTFMAASMAALGVMLEKKRRKKAQEE